MTRMNSYQFYLNYTQIETILTEDVNGEPYAMSPRLTVGPGEGRLHLKKRIWGGEYTNITGISPILVWLDAEKED